MATTKKVKEYPQSLHQEILQATKPILDKVSKLNQGVETLAGRMEYLVKLLEERKESPKIHNHVEYIDKEALQSLIAEPFLKLHEDIRLLRIEVKNKEAPNLTISAFSKKSGRSVGTIRNYLDEGKLSYHQAGKGFRITIPVAELEKIKQL